MEVGEYIWYSTEMIPEVRTHASALINRETEWWSMLMREFDDS